MAATPGLPGVDLMDDARLVRIESKVDGIRDRVDALRDDVYKHFMPKAEVEHRLESLEANQNKMVWMILGVLAAGVGSMFVKGGV